MGGGIGISLRNFIPVAIILRYWCFSVLYKIYRLRMLLLFAMLLLAYCMWIVACLSFAISDIDSLEQVVGPSCMWFYGKIWNDDRGNRLCLGIFRMEHFRRSPSTCWLGDWRGCEKSIPRWSGEYSWQLIIFRKTCCALPPVYTILSRSGFKFGLLHREGEDIVLVRTHFRQDRIRSFIWPRKKITMYSYWEFIFPIASTKVVQRH